ncbi:hypothetical protein LCGC14_2560160, partial [marine sediment metagenome]
MINKDDKLILADSNEELVKMGHSINTLMPGGESLSKNQAISVANYSLLVGANPFRGEIYGYKNKKGELVLGDGYKLLNRWAKKISDYDDKYSERLPPGVERLEEGDIGYRITITRHDKRGGIKEYTKLGASFKEALDIVSTSAIGIVLKKEMWSTKWNKPIDAPTGWTWDAVARKRALKNGLNLAYAMPGLAELAKETWVVEGVKTNPDDWAIEGTYNTPAEAERHAQLSSEQRERKEEVGQMTDEERSSRATVIEDATELMAENGDDDPLG